MSYQHGVPWAQTELGTPLQPTKHWSMKNLDSCHLSVKRVALLYIRGYQTVCGDTWGSHWVPNTEHVESAIILKTAAEGSGWPAELPCAVFTHIKSLPHSPRASFCICWVPAVLQTRMWVSSLCGMKTWHRHSLLGSEHWGKMVPTGLSAMAYPFPNRKNRHNVTC